MKTRREFLELGALAALAGSARAFGGEQPLAVKGIRIGVQMWSVNDLWKKNPADALRRLKALGYDGCSPSGSWRWTGTSSRRCCATTGS